MVLFARKNLRKGDQLFYNYGRVYWENKKDDAIMYEKYVDWYKYYILATLEDTETYLISLTRISASKSDNISLPPLAYIFNRQSIN